MARPRTTPQQYDSLDALLLIFSDPAEFAKSLRELKELRDEARTALASLALGEDIARREAQSKAREQEAASRITQAEERERQAQRAVDAKADEARAIDEQRKRQEQEIAHHESEVQRLLTHLASVKREIAEAEDRRRKLEAKYAVFHADD